MPTKGISIIIPTLNEEKTISQCLEPVVNIPGIEVIVSDGGSTDRTVEIAGQHRDVKIVSSLTGRSIMYQRRNPSLPSCRLHTIKGGSFDDSTDI